MIIYGGNNMKWNEAKAIILKNEEVRNELKKNEAEYRIIEEIIMARKEKNLTQKDLAELIGTRQSNISRLESGNYNPSLEFLNKIAHAVGKELEVRII
jgi:DNA-binding XRE family transcriptional regulator